MEKFVKSNFLVISDYNWLPDDISEWWVDKISDNYLVYDRAGRWEESDKIKRQKNVGQNIYDMLDFIVTHYEDLPEVTVFCRACVFFPKGRPYPMSNGNTSEDKFMEIVNNKTFTEIHDESTHNGQSSKFDVDGFGYMEINNSWYLSHMDNHGNMAHPHRYYNNLNTFLLDVYKNPVISDYIRFSPGAAYIVPREMILKNSKGFYEKLRMLVSWGENIRMGEAHMLERALYTIFTCDWEKNEKYK